MLNEHLNKFGTEKLDDITNLNIIAERLRMKLFKNEKINIWNHVAKENIKNRLKRQ